MKNYSEIAKEIVAKHHLQKYVDALLRFWKQNPPTVGHGFSHVVRVGVEAYEIGLLNNYDKPEILFVGGLFHDVVRPVTNEGGNEDQTAGAEVVKKLFAEIGAPKEYLDLVVGAIISHDNWIGTENPPLFDALLSLGDKASHSIAISDGYMWTSNNYCRSNNIPLASTSHKDTMLLFTKYQIRAWKLFTSHQFAGQERAENAYLDVTAEVIRRCKEEPTAEYVEFLDKRINSIRKSEEEFLESFAIPSREISKLMALCY